uniref:Testis development related protein n=1 Tax=Mola mola TaxID=94237 RepID=A0A3Q3XKK5_MOLML
QEEEGPNAVSQLARKQRAGAKGWSRLSALFDKDDEHQLLEETKSPPVADSPLAVKPEEPPQPTKRSGFWDNFAASWAAKKQADAAAAAAANEDRAEEAVTGAGGEGSQDGQITEGEGSDGRGGGGWSSNNSFSKYVSLGGGSEEVSFKWNFVTSKLAELRAKTN